MKWIKHAAITIAVGLAGLFIVLILAVAWAVNNVESVWRLVEHHLLPADMTVSWVKIDFTARRISGADFDITMDAAGLRIVKESPRIDVTVSEIHLRADVTPFSSKPKVRVRELRVLAPEPGSVGPTGSGPSGAEQNPFERLNSLMQGARTVFEWTDFGRTQIEVTDLIFATTPPVHLTLRAERADFTDEEIAVRFEASRRDSTD